MVHLHVHTKYSLLDATIKIEELAEKLKSIGQNTIAITDHGNLYGAVEAYKVLSDNGIKAITGCEMYICDDVNIQNKDSKYYHLILLCKNNQGRLNLNHLVTESCNYKYYGKPRIDFSMLEKYHDGLICSSACMAGEISRAISDNDMDTARQVAKKYRNLFGEDFYIEYQSHENEEQQKLNAKLIQLANELGIKYYVTCDAHYLNKEDQKYHSVFVRIGSMREAGETYDDCYIQSEQEILEKCYLTTKYNKEAIRVTEEIAAKCENTIPLSAPILPHVPIPEQFSTEEDYFKYLCNKGFKEKGFADWDLDQWKQYYTETVEIDGEQVTRQLAEFNSAKEIRDRYIDRCRYEMNAIVKMGFVGYYLLVHSYVTCVNRRGIARGSGGGSLLAYLSGIVDIDPIKYGLYFERFVDVGALSLLENGQITKKELKIPDFDTDFAPSERDIAVEFVSKRYGSENFVAIGQFGYIKAKGAIKDIGKVLGIPFEVTNTMTKSLDNETTIQDALDLGLLDAYKSDYPELFVYASHLAGLPKSFGVHPCGKIICMNPAVTYNAVEYNENKNEMVLQGDMHTADDLGLVKCDFLGLRTLDVIYDVLDMIGKDYNYIAPHKINTSDKLVWNEFAEGHTDCIFQFESPGMKRMLKDMKCDNIENLSAANALYRPGSKDYIPNYVSRKNGTEEITYLHPDLEPILSNSYGIIVFQEQLIEIGRLAGLSNPDELRKATAKKKPKLMAKIEPELKGGLMNRGWTQQQVDDLWTTILQFAKYSFNKSHSSAYALTAYISMYMKVHHTGEFFAACINSYEGDIKGIVKSIQEGKRMGVSFQFRNWRNINSITEYDNGVVWLGINTIKGFGSSVANALHCISEECRTFTDFLVLSDQQPDISYAQIDTLITHNFFSEFGEISKLLNIHKLFDLVYFRKVFTKGDNLPISEEIVKKYSKETKKQYRDIRSKELFEDLCETIETPKFPIIALLNAELEDFGYINYTNPKAKNFYYITSIDTTYSPKLSLYDMCNGVEVSVKVSKKMFKNNPLCVGQIIKAVITSKPKVTKVDGDWVEVPNQFDNWLQTYIVKM